MEAQVEVNTKMMMNKEGGLNRQQYNLFGHKKIFYLQQIPFQIQGSGTLFVLHCSFPAHFESSPRRPLTAAEVEARVARELGSWGGERIPVKIRSSSGSVVFWMRRLCPGALMEINYLRFPSDNGNSDRRVRGRAQANAPAGREMLPPSPLQRIPFGGAVPRARHCRGSTNRSHRHGGE